MGQHNGRVQSNQYISHKLHVHHTLPETRQMKEQYVEGRRQAHTRSYMYNNVPVEARFLPLIIRHSYTAMRTASSGLMLRSGRLHLKQVMSDCKTTSPVVPDVGA